MRRYYYDDDDIRSDRRSDEYWEDRLKRALRDKDGFAWGVFFFGLVVGAIIF